MSLLDLPSNLFRNICSHLSGQDTLRLQCTCRYMNQQLTAYSDALFTVHLKQDFPEGERILDAYRLRQSSIGDTPPEYKQKLYMAFLHRWKVPPKREEEYQSCKWSQQQPRGNITAEDLKSIESLVFIVRFWNCPDSCALLDWTADWTVDRDTDYSDDEEPNPPEDTYYLKIDEEWYDDLFDDLISLPFDCHEFRHRMMTLDDLEGEEYQNLHDEIRDQANSLCRFTVNAFDFKTLQVMSIIENAPGELLRWDPYYMSFNFTESIPHFFGTPLASSPFYRDSDNAQDFGGSPDIRSLTLAGSFDLGFLFEQADVPADRLVNYVESFEIRQRFSTQSRLDICSYFRALMREKCTSLFFNKRHECEDSLTKDSPTLHPEQPIWIDEEKIMDTLMSYVPFELQSTTMRLVSKSFKKAAMHELEKKLLDNTKLPIAFERYDGASWFRADARRGWSDTLTSRDALIEDTLWKLSCRCFSSCKKADCCPGMKTAPKIRLEDGTIKTLNLVEARNTLTSTGELFFAATNNTSKKSRHNPPVRISYETDSECTKNLYQLCSSVYHICDKGVEYEYLSPDYLHLAKFYGLGSGLTHESFLRRLFLVYTNGTDLEKGHFPEITHVGYKMKFETPDRMTYFRKKKIIRFESAMQEPMEIALEDEHIIY